MDISELAHTVAVYLTPFLPYLVKASEKAAEEAGKKFGGEAWDKAKSVWAKLGPKVEAKPAALDAVQDVAASSSDEDAIDSLRLQLKKLLKDDDQLASDIAQQLGPGGTSTHVIASGKGSVAVGRDAIGSTIITGQGNSVGNKNITGDGNVIGDSNTVTVSKRSYEGITLAEFVGLITQIRDMLHTSDLADRTIQVIDADAQLIEEEARLEYPSRPLIETKLKGIEAIVKGSTETGGKASPLAPTIRRAVEYAQALFK